MNPLAKMRGQFIPYPSQNGLNALWFHNYSFNSLTSYEGNVLLFFLPQRIVFFNYLYWLKLSSELYSPVNTRFIYGMSKRKILCA